MKLQKDLAESALHRVAGPLHVATDAAATGIIRLAEVKMALAVKSVTTERGLDPRDFMLMAYGGCGPLHAVSIARELAIPHVAISAGAVDIFRLGHAGRGSAARSRAYGPGAVAGHGRRMGGRPL